jgi:1,4-alpha-glucan branching enzyme
MNVRATSKAPPLDPRETQALALHGDPFHLLGPHDTPAGPVVRAILPNARYAEVLRRRDRGVIGRLEHVQDGIFQGFVS